MFGEITGKHALLLQGPMGPFFWRFREELHKAGCRVSKVNFNFADSLFYPDPLAIAYKGKFQDWPDYFRKLLDNQKVDIIFLFGDARPYHLSVIEIALSKAIPVYCFEEGYLRPDYITLERCGVNGYSNLPRNPEFYLSQPLQEIAEPLHVDGSFGRAAWYASMYSLFLTLFAWRYPHYRHHRPLQAIQEGLFWIRGYLRKKWFGFKERKWLPRLSGALSGRYFFVPLQVHNDAQILHHSKYYSVKEFMTEVMASFSESARADDYLVIKHHPLDRGYRDYTQVIKQLATTYKLQNRVIYVHDLHLPTLLKHARGTVLINSTVGLSSLLHHTPVKVMGDAVYDMRGLTNQFSLAEFWHKPGEIDQKLHQHFRSWLLSYNQLNGNYYKPMPGTDNPTGVVWGIKRAFESVFAPVNKAEVIRLPLLGREEKPLPREEPGRKAS